MSNKRLRYFSYYGCNDPRRKRNNSPAADTKMDYIMEVLNRIGYNVDHVSLAQSSMSKYLSGYCEKKGMNTYRYFASFGETTSIFRVFNRWFIHLQFMRAIEESAVGDMVCYYENQNPIEIAQSIMDMGTPKHLP